jgi:hypothetical protein
MNVDPGHIEPSTGDVLLHGWGAIFRDRRLEPLRGFHAPERDELGQFCWTRAKFTFGLTGQARFLTIYACRPSGNATLRYASGGRELGAIRLVAGWERYGIALSAEFSPTIEFNVGPGFEAPGDGRELGLMLRQIALHDDARLHDLTVRRLANVALNAAEFEAGATALHSIPPMLRLTMEVRCNIADKEPCVYCSWGWAKREEAGAPAFTLDVIREFGDFLDLAREVNDSSYGEPPLNPQFADIAGLLSGDGREFSFASNGETLGPRVREALLGRRIQLYVSIDSATSRGFSRYRDDRFEQILENLRSLCQDKKTRDDLPFVTASFIVMNSNKAEIGDFLRRMKTVGVDRVYLRALWPDDRLDNKVQQRDGFTFDYDAEPVDLAELRGIGEDAKRQAREIDLWTLVEWESFIADQKMPSGTSSTPLCSEPWKTIYALNRGIMPCCFGRKSFAHWHERGERTIPQFLRDVFNGPAYQELRRELAAGRLSSYCRESPNCPIVRRAAQSDASEPDPS